MFDSILRDKMKSLLTFLNDSFKKTKSKISDILYTLH